MCHATVGYHLKIGTYIELSSDADNIDKRTFMSFCLAVGAHVSTYIRKAYLENNLTYLGYLKQTFAQNGMRCLSDEQCAQTGEKLRQWMSYNPWWRDACRSPTTFNQEGQEGKVPTIYKHIIIKSFSSVKDGQLCVDELIRTASGHIAIPLDLCENARIEKPFDEKYNVVISVSGNSCWASNMLEFVDEILVPDLEKEIHVMLGAFDLFSTQLYPLISDCLTSFGFSWKSSVLTSTNKIGLVPALAMCDYRLFFIVWSNQMREFLNTCFRLTVST